MRTFIGVLSLVVLIGCQPTQPTVIINTNTNTNTLNGGGSVDPTATPTSCLPAEVEPIRVDITAPLTVPIGGSGGIDATPKSSTGVRGDGCNITQGIYWTATPTNVCSVPQPTVFTTVMKCAVGGSCQLTATVPGKGASGVATVSCQ